MENRDGFVIDARFRGPPQSANGGYCCGCMAGFLGEPAEITLRSPPPLDTPLEFVEGELKHGETLVATGRRVNLKLELPRAVSLEEARASQRYYLGRTSHPYPECFVCGPAREPGDGLRIFPGRSEPGRPVAGEWKPDASLADERGLVRPEFLWSALDCPGYFGVVERPVKALLGRMTGLIEQPLEVGHPCIVMGWSLGTDGRKLHAGSALFSEAGKLIARSQQTWIKIA